MARSEPPLQSIADQPTRQQLDELDALMRQMLALPVNSSESAPATPDAEAAPTSNDSPATGTANQHTTIPPKSSLPRTAEEPPVEESAQCLPSFEQAPADASGTESDSYVTQDTVSPFACS